MRTTSFLGPRAPTRLCPAASALALVVLAAATSLADSEIVLAYPPALGRIRASTFATTGTRTSDADLVIAAQEDGRIRMSIRYGDPDGAHTTASALFESLDSGSSLRLLEQESHSVDPKGDPLPSLRIDHVARRATCESTQGTQSLHLPETDRVVNVPMNLFLLPLVRGEQQSLQFQLFLCRDGARLMEFAAWPVGSRDEAGKLIEIRYGPDLGGLFSVLAQSFAPRLSFWFDPSQPHAWAGHRLPLYTGGPEVIVVRDGVASAELMD